MGTSFDEVTGRVVNCVMLREKSCASPSGTDGNDKCASVFFCSTHFPAGNVTRQLQSVGVLSRMFSQYRRDFTNGSPNKKLTMMVSGDFNSAPGTDTHAAMME